MSKLESLNSICKVMTSEISLIRDFAQEVDFQLVTQRESTPKITLTHKENEELDQILSALSNASASIRKGRGERVTVEVTTSDRVINIVNKLIYPIKQQTFMAEMALTYLVSYFEAFIKEYTEQILVDNPNMLRSGASMSHEKALSFKSMKDLRRGLAQSEVEALGYGSIDDIEAYFQKKLHIQLSTFVKWTETREHMYRRNLVIHNRGRVNEIYRKKTGYKGHKVLLNTNLPYVVDAATTLIELIEFIHAKTTERLCLT